MKTTFSSGYSIITFATSKNKYAKFALNCASSVLHFNKINFYIISDLAFDIPPSLKKNIFIIKAKPEHLNQGTGIKLYIDQYLQTKFTLFMDADCLCYGSLQPLFKAFENKHVSVVGNTVEAIDWCGEKEAKSIYKKFVINKLARFNGGVYFVTQSTKATEIFNRAREIATQYDELGFQRIHQIWINEEILISLAMALYKEKPVADDGSWMTDLYTDQHTAKLNVLVGYCEINNPKVDEPFHRPWYTHKKLKPLIVHFGSSSLYKYPYLSQHILLKFNTKKVSSFIATILTTLFIHVPYQSKYWIYAKLGR